MRKWAHPLASSASIVTLAALAAHCGSDAVGIDACYRIESKRCEVAPACGVEHADVDACKGFYRDQCLAGIENTQHSPTESEVKACEAAIGAAAACAKSGKNRIGECAAAPTVSEVDPATATCKLVIQTTHQLAACSFLAAPSVDAGTTSGTDAGAGDAGAGDAGDGGGTGGSGGTGGAAPK